MDDTWQLLIGDIAIYPDLRLDKVQMVKVKAVEQRWSSLKCASGVVPKIEIAWASMHSRTTWVFPFLVKGLARLCSISLGSLSHVKWTGISCPTQGGMGLE
ncbi:hypothetical protein FNV43_RR12969 [Rhamnella rubrinervis]|uniref:Uncharacterized protein n=1 Tax=Rhamnella rubrinervis TaxID=2594499 RepID=A0A8K0MEI0_9ROSA|nr:hypothetical protein FNV43_RR12969 [Rhamnella rubrinervis]